MCKIYTSPVSFLWLRLDKPPDQAPLLAVLSVVIRAPETGRAGSGEHTVSSSWLCSENPMCKFYSTLAFHVIFMSNFYPTIALHAFLQCVIFTQQYQNQNECRKQNNSQVNHQVKYCPNCDPTCSFWRISSSIILNNFLILSIF